MYINIHVHISLIIIIKKKTNPLGQRQLDESEFFYVNKFNL